MSKNWNPNGTGHDRIYGLIQQDTDMHTCVAIFTTRASAEAFQALQEREQEQAIVLAREQLIRELRPYEEYASPCPDRTWSVQALALNPKNTTEIYTS